MPPSASSAANRAGSDPELESGSSRRRTAPAHVSGGLRYSPTMSSSFSAKAGSLLILKVSTRCGFNPWARQMLLTLASLMPTAAAMVRVLQCVALVGCRRVVTTTTRLLRRALMLGATARNASFCNPAEPSARKRFRNRETFFGAMAGQAAISRSC
jgi:hypothetical protein